MNLGETSFSSFNLLVQMGRRRLSSIVLRSLEFCSIRELCSVFGQSKEFAESTIYSCS
jgi:hypothetical protein